MERCKTIALHYLNYESYNIGRQRGTVDSKIIQAHEIICVRKLIPNAVNISQIMIFTLYTVYKSMIIIKIHHQTREKLYYHKCSNNFAVDCSSSPTLNLLNLNLSIKIIRTIALRTAKLGYFRLPGALSQDYNFGPSRRRWHLCFERPLICS